jgi:hypothetical protein
MRTHLDEPLPILAKNPLDHELLLIDRAYLPRNFRITPPLQDRLTRIYYEARKRAAAAAVGAAMSANATRVEIAA